MVRRLREQSTTEDEIVIGNYSKRSILFSFQRPNYMGQWILIYQFNIFRYTSAEET